MTPPSLLFAAVALVPAMTSPAEGAPQQSAVSALVVALCNGGSMTVPLGTGSPPATPCCCAKGCRASRKRNRFDREQ
jgi:hypothetical protein